MTHSTDTERAAFLEMANADGFDIAHTFDTDRSTWVFLNPATADLWKYWQAARRAPAAPVQMPEPVGSTYTLEALVPGGRKVCHVTLHRSLPAGTNLYAEPDVRALLASATESRQRAQQELEDCRAKISRIGLDIDRARRGEVNEQSPIASRLRGLASAREVPLDRIAVLTKIDAVLCKEKNPLQAAEEICAMAAPKEPAPSAAASAPRLPGSNSIA